MAASKPITTNIDLIDSMIYTYMSGRKKIDNQDMLNKEAEFFEAQVKVLCGIKDIKLKTKKEGLNKQKKSIAKNQLAIQGMYSHQKHRALQEILIGPSEYCPIEATKIEEHYAELLSVKRKCDIADLSQYLWQRNKPSETANSNLMKEIKPTEVKYKLLAKIHDPLTSSRSLGLDRISFSNLRYADSDYSRIAYLFNACLNLHTVPKCWMEFFSVLVKIKKNDLDSSDDEEDESTDIKNWKPITMQRTISKLFQSVIAARLISWAKYTGRLSATQKGFLSHNAACESSFILQECKNYAEDKEKDLVIAWLDFTNASDSIPQSAVLHALNKHSLPLPIIELIQNILAFSETKFRVMNDTGFTKTLKILNGLPQGSPITPILLDLVIEPILKSLVNAVNDTFEIYNKKINHYAIPNELTLITDSPQKLQNLLNLVEKNAKLIGLKFKINKCSTYHYEGKKKEMKADTSFLFFGQRLSILPKENIEEYFGVKQGLSIGQEGCPTIPEMIDNIGRITDSLLTWYQKVESILIYIIPRVENGLRGLQNVDTTALEKTDRILKAEFKKLLGLSADASTESIVYQVSGTTQTIKEEQKRTVKFHYLPFMDLFYIMKVVHGLKMLTSEDEVVKTVAFGTLTAEVNRLIAKKKDMPVTRQNLAQYLSGILKNVKNMKSKSMWHMVREATSKLKLKIPIKWQYKNGMQLIIHESNEKKHVSNGRNPRSIEEKLKITLVEYYINEVMKRSSGPEDNLKAMRP